MQKTELLSLQEYILIAQKIVCRFCRYRSKSLVNLLMSNESVTNIANKLMIADTEFNGKGNINGYRKIRAMWEIYSILKQSQLQKNRNVPLSVAYDNGKETYSGYGIMHTMINRESRDERDPLSNMIEDEENSELWNILDSAVDSGTISSESKDRLVDYIVNNMSMEEIASTRGVSKQAISDNIGNTLKKLRPLFEKSKVEILN